MHWFLIVLLFLSSAVFGASEGTGHGNKKLPSAVVVGTVYCDTCFQQGFSKASRFLSGASVAVECKAGPSGQVFRQEVKTNKQGEFRVKLPFSVAKHVRKIKSCSVELISSNEPYCSVASAASSDSLRLQSRRQGTHIFSAGFFTFKPLNQPNMCNEKPSLEEVNSNKAVVPPNFDPTFPPPLQDPPTPSTGFLPPLPFLPNLPPLPQLPPLPSLPGLPNIPPKTEKTTRDDNLNAKLKSDSSVADQKLTYPEFFFPPNPFRPPSVFPPNPLQPPSLLPPSPLQPAPLLPPNPLQPPPAPLIPLPPIPGLTPPPPTPGLPFPFPQPPFPPSTSFPGVPPASSSSSSSSSPAETSSP
ncbi:vegetative cell wall protein gp1 [Punica granatum]|uniref:Uncharacterized protein n=2 Tax=Punica granatum TaxID=22663 RepID=A0A218XIV9_PUNGR|nr:vegetative cell wall protein gp1 [Punica granatum]OWM84710.1 hypothetical protein CDL15_Pgr027497 [Punica granatum]PKI69860.1 hypothetical protein CRG98_009735 [Punica granatum]